MTDDNGNGRVTMALLGAKLDQVLAELKEIKQCQRDDHDRLGKVESRAETNREALDALREKVEGIDTRDRWWNGGNSVAALIAGAIATIMGGGQP